MKLLRLVGKQIKLIYPLLCLYYMFIDCLAQIRYQRGEIGTDSGAAHLALELAESVAYLEEVFADYKHYAGVPRFHGRVAEVGPGDNCGVGLLFLEDGCRCVDLVDRFYSKRDNQAQARIYRLLRERHPGLQPFLEGADLNDEGTFQGLKRCYGAEAAAEEFFVRHQEYDFIVSRAVFEHIYDPSRALREMVKALNSGGMLLHKVDLRDHGMFSSHFHELKFLESPKWLHRRMTIGSGLPNRVLIHEYQKCLEATAVKFDLLVTRLAGVGEIRPHLQYADIPEALREKSLKYVRSVRRKFTSALRDVSDEDLSVAGVFIVARKGWPSAKPGAMICEPLKAAKRDC